MCGIAGILRITAAADAARALIRPMNEAIPESWLEVLDRSIRHRGPDGQGRFRDRAVRADGSVVDVALVHRRLSIIDHAGGGQPMVSVRGPKLRQGARNSGVVKPLVFHGGPDEAVAYRTIDIQPSDDLVATVFNGCIYNHRELRAELQGLGHRFETDHSDTEVLLHGWREWGLGAHDDNDGMPVRFGGLCERLSDMYSFCVWDRVAANVYLGRDEFGQKPLMVWSGTQEGCKVFAFSSTASGLVSLIREAGKSVRIEEAGVSQWVRYGASSQSLFEGMHEVFPGHVACVIRGKSEDTWGFERFHPRANIGHMSGVLSLAPIWIRRHHGMDPDEVERLLRASVMARVEADVPVACFLSGGVDSSLVAKYAKEFKPDLETFTVRMPSAAFDESVYAQRAAEQIGCRHATLECEANPVEDVRALIAELGLPFGDSSLLPTHWLSRAVSSRAKVSLSGDGGDELFGGYERYRGATWLKLWPLLAMWPIGPNGEPKSSRTKLHRLASAARHDRYADLVSLFPKADWTRLCGQERIKRIEELPGGKRYRGAGIERAMYSDTHDYLPQTLMRKSDTASMHSALEVRAPMLDPLLAAEVRSTTIGSLMPLGQRKGLLRQLARKYFPSEIVDRPKMGFAIPIGEWFRSDYGGLRSLLLDRLNSREPFGSPSLGIDLNMAYVRQMLDEHLGTGVTGLVKRDHSQRLYMLLVLSIWAESVERGV